MDKTEGKSEVARVMQQIDLELEAARHALHGFAITARHDFINARMQRNGERILHLIDEGRHEEAQTLMDSDNWAEDSELQTIERDCTQEILRCTPNDKLLTCHSSQATAWGSLEEESPTTDGKSPGESFPQEGVDKQEKGETKP